MSRKPFYALEVNVESKSMGFDTPSRSNRPKAEKPLLEPKAASSGNIVPHRVSGLLNKP